MKNCPNRCWPYSTDTILTQDEIRLQQNKLPQFRIFPGPRHASAAAERWGRPPSGSQGRIRTLEGLATPACPGPRTVYQSSTKTGTSGLCTNPTDSVATSPDDSRRPVTRLQRTAGTAQTPHLVEYTVSLCAGTNLQPKFRHGQRLFVPAYKVPG